MSVIESKIQFVAEINAAVTKVQDNVERIEYEVYGNESLSERYEMLVIHYVGGAKSVRSCTANSHSAIFKEIARMLDHGYYDEISWYDSITKDPNISRVYK